MTRHNKDEREAQSIRAEDVGNLDDVLGKDKPEAKQQEAKPEALREDMVGADHPAAKPRTLYRVEVNGNPHGRGDLFPTREDAEKAKEELKKNAGPDAQLLDWTVGEEVHAPTK